MSFDYEKKILGVVVIISKEDKHFAKCDVLSLRKAVADEDLSRQVEELIKNCQKECEVKFSEWKEIEEVLYFKYIKKALVKTI